MIEVTKVRPLFLTPIPSLDVDDSPSLRLSAGSGIVQVGPCLYVVADDELHLGVFSVKDPTRPGTRMPLLEKEFPGGLPDDTAARKKLKPDLEVLTLIPGEPAALLALPSGSKSNRTLGAWIPLTVQGEVNPTQTGKTVVCTPLYQTLLGEIPDLNIEGAAVSGSVFRLFHRGNSKAGRNCTIDLHLARLIQALKQGAELNESLLTPGTQIRDHSLGELRGVPLSFTDACAIAGERTVFIAAAEATDSTYDDGQYVGAVVGLLGADGQVQRTEELRCPYKPEGVWPVSGKPDTYWLVTDADDVGRASELFQFTFTA